AEIESRLDAVSELTGKISSRSELRKLLNGIQDLERLLAKITLGTVTPRELLALGKSLAQLPLVTSVTDKFENQLLKRPIDPVAEVKEKILTAISDEPPALLADGG